jgi:hypothetical protein
VRNKFKEEILKIDLPEELHSRSKIGVLKAKAEMKKTISGWYFLSAPTVSVILAITLLPPNRIHEFIPGKPNIEIVEQSNAYDTSDPRKLVGFSDNVFIGKVVEQVGTKALNDIPETQYKVEVLDNIKGDLNGMVKVNQQGGYHWNKIVLFEGDKLLKEGQIYLFATRYLERENWHTLVPVDGDVPISNEEEKSELIIKYSKAYKEEIPFIQINNN